MKLYLTPTIKEVGIDNGVGKVVEAQYRYLPDYGIEFVFDPGEADVIAAHVMGDHLPELDVLHLHGAYFTADPQPKEFARWQHDTNRRIATGARRARAITMPSHWASEFLRRDMRINPTVIPNGVDLDLWAGDHANGHYVLWNKNRPDDVCDPTPAHELAKRGVTVVSTYKPADIPREALPDTLKITGRLPFAEMISFTKHADVYLATTKEVMSLSVLEALAAGVPVLGYKWGGTAEVIEHKREGWLCEPGDIDGLMVGLEWIRSNRDAASKAAREKAKAYAWPQIIQRYADLYWDIHERKQHKSHRVAVVVTSFNYGHYLPQALQSVLGQTAKPEEIIVVNDGSTDNTAEIANNFSEQGVRLLNQDNQGVAHARNAGIAVTSADYIICLDADDALHPRYIETLLPALKENRGLGVAWTKLALCDENLQPTGNVWDFDFKWEDQAHPHPLTGGIVNGVPCAAMFRREMWERAGGFKQCYHPAEDAEFWLRGLSVGFEAKRVTDDPLFFYRQHPGSASSKPTPPIHIWHPWSKDKQYPFAAPSRKQPLVRSYSQPLISVIIPVGPGHARYLPAALDSLLGQSFREWEAIVVDDANISNEVPGTLEPYPFAKYVIARIGAEYAKGAGAARNAGLELAKAPLCLFLDADDYLMPDALEKMVRLYAETGRYVYTDWVAFDGQKFEAMTTPDYTQEGWLSACPHAVTVLMETEQARALGGFDTTLPGWEDWEFFIKATYAGYCGQRLAEPLLYYRVHSGQRREVAQKESQKLLQIFRERYERKEIMACCGGNPISMEKAREALAQLESVGEQVTNGLIELEYTGEAVLPVTYRAASGATYRAGQVEKFIKVPPGDAESLVALGVFEVA